MTEFPKQKGRKFGVGSQCKRCVKAYRDSPEIKARRSAAQRAIRATPEYKAKRALMGRERRKTPEYKAYIKAYRARPEVKAKMKSYYARPEVKAYIKAYHARPEVKAKMKSYYARPEVRAKQNARDRLKYKSEDERAQDEKEKAEELELRKTLPSKIPFGYERWDGKLFWSYMKNCKFGERWIERDLFERKVIEQTLRAAVDRAWKGGKSSFEIIGLPPTLAVDVDLHKREIAQKIFPGQKLHRDHMRPLSLAKDREDAIRRNHFTNFAYIPESINRSKSDCEFWEWFKVQSKSVQKCITMQCKYNEKIRAEISQT